MRTRNIRKHGKHTNRNANNRRNNNNNNNNNVPDKNEVNITLIIENISNKKTAIFCRVSTLGQSGPTTISFSVQENKGRVCAGVFKLKVICVIMVVESAYDGKASSLKSLIHKYRGGNVIIYDVSRFCRNVDTGLELLNYALNCRTRLFFVNEGIVWDKNNMGNRDRLVYELRMAERESAQIGKRVSDALREKKRLGYFTGGVPRYGYKVVDAEGGRRAVPDEEEQMVLKFINMCRTPQTSVKTLNKWVFQLSQDRQPIVLENGERANKKLEESLSYVCISNLLNSYGIDKRGRIWSSSKVSNVCKYPYENVLEGMKGMRFN